MSEQTISRRIVQGGSLASIAAMAGAAITLSIERHYGLLESELDHEDKQIEREQCAELLGMMQNQWRIIVEQCRVNCGVIHESESGPLPPGDEVACPSCDGSDGSVWLSNVYHSHLRYAGEAE